MIAHVQFEKYAVDFSLDFSEKKNSISRYADPGESLPCTEFLTPSSPNNALIEFGASILAT